VFKAAAGTALGGAADGPTAPGAAAPHAYPAAASEAHKEAFATAGTQSWPEPTAPTKAVGAAVRSGAAGGAIAGAEAHPPLEELGEKVWMPVARQTHSKGAAASRTAAARAMLLRCIGRAKIFAASCSTASPAAGDNFRLDRR